MFRAGNSESSSNLFDAGMRVVAVSCASVYLFAKQVWVSCLGWTQLRGWREEMTAEPLPQHAMHKYRVLMEVVTGSLLGGSFLMLKSAMISSFLAAAGSSLKG